MTDLFNNFDIEIQNSKQTPKGLSPEKDKNGLILFKPKEDIYPICSYFGDGIEVKHSIKGSFQASFYDKLPVSMGLGYYVNNELERVVEIAKDEDDSMFMLTSIDGDKTRKALQTKLVTRNTINTVSLNYANGVYSITINKAGFNGILKRIVFNDIPVLFIEFDSILKSAVVGPTYKFDRDITSRITEKPNFFIKDKNE